ncbi:hypothetical protein Gotri_014469, partial [Gossypium trilobum]|nr:hypothetical protein [Gossypium trilobum]
IKRTVDASDDWWESKLKVVPEAQKFRTSSIYPEFQGNEFFKDVDNDIPEENEEENVRNDVHIDGNGQRKENT